MKFALLFLLMVFSSVALSRPVKFISPVKSSICQSTIPNTHFLDTRNGIIIRGMAPVDELKKIPAYIQLLKWGVTDILIFRSVKDDSIIQDEMNALMSLKTSSGDHFISRDRITHIPFKWKEFNDFKTPCRQTIQALNILKNISKSPKRILFFHCTVGEDRTGLLSGLYRILSYNWTPERAFYKEMCPHGYGAANPQKKLTTVVQPIRDNITVFYEAMIELITSNKINFNNLNPKACDSLKPISFYRLKSKNLFKCKALKNFSTRSCEPFNK